MSGEADKPGTSAAETIFFAALSLSPPERTDYLAGACGDNEQLRQRVEALLRVHDAPDGFLPEESSATPAGDPAVANLLAAKLTEQPGDIIGRYKLREKIGEGGCGVVYLAEQEQPVRRKVALKVIKLGMDTRQVVARFEAERQALALMDHPNIARVIDAGATEMGRPYFVMELVGGNKITDYCEQNQLDTRQRLDLFIQVCRAIQHAHQKGVIHRDIKPSNVLVATHDGVPVPKVIDFGIAKATQGRLTDQSVFTAFEQFIGTPAYMSPEQAQLGGLDVDTRSDIYSLGVLLYELLTGKTPFDSKELLASGLEAMRRTIQEKDPPTPSTRLKQENATRLANTNDPSRVTRHASLDKDLDWIVMKCLEKDRARRYETANGLARDIERHLTSEPVIARPPSRFYSLQKLYRRNRLVFAAGLLIFVVCLLGGGGAFWEWRQATRHAALERNERLRAQTALTKMEAIEVGRAEEFYQAGDRRNMLPHLALVLRQNPSNRIAAERLMSTLSHRTWARLACPPMEHSNRVTFAMFSTDGKRVVTSASDKTAWVWDAATGRRLAGPFAHAAEINMAAFSPDGRLVVTASQDKTARIWNAETGAPVTEPLPFDDNVYTAQFSPDGRLVLATGGRIGQLWDVSTGKRVGAALVVGGFVADARFSPDGSRLAMALEFDGQAQVWEVSSGACRHRLKHGNRIRSVAFSPDGKWLVTGSHDHTARVWDVESGQPIFEPLHHERTVWGAEFSPDGQRIVTASEDHTAQIWDVRTGQRIGRPLKHDDAVKWAMFSPEGLRVVTASSDKTVRVWDAETGEPLTEPLSQESGSFLAQFHNDGQRVLTASNGKAVLIWDASPAALLTLYLEKQAWCAGFSPDAKSLIPGTSLADTHLREVLTGKVLSTLGEKSLCVGCEVNDISFSPDGKLAAAAADGGAFAVYDLGTGKQLTPVRALHGDNVVSCCFSHDGGKLVTASWDRTAVVWESRTGKPLTPPLRHQARLKWAEFSPDDQFILTTSEDAVARVWDIRDGTLTRELKHEGEVNSAHFNADGTQAVTASSDLTARVWDLHTGKSIGILTHAMAVQSALFSPNRQLIVTTMGRYGDLRLWDALTCKPLTEPFGEGSAVEFRPDGKRLIVHSASHNFVEIRDALNGQRLSEPLLHTEINRFSHLSSDSRFVVAGTQSGARIWEAPEASLPVPEWLPALAEALAGQRFNQQGVLESVGPSLLWAVQGRMKAGTTPDSLYSRWAKWFLADAATRTVLPSSPLTLAQHAQSLAERRVSYAAAKEALLLQPTNVTAMTAVAQTTTNATFADWLSGHAVDLAPDSQGDSQSAPWVIREDILRKSGRFGEAIALLDRYKPLWSKNPWIWGHRGESFQKLGRLEDALESYSKAISVARSTDPKWPERDRTLYSEILNSLLIQRWHLLKQLNRPAEAQRVGQRSYRWDPAADFSATDNPIGPWSYGYSLALGGPMTQYTKQVNISGLDIWLHNIASNDPEVYNNPTTNTILINSLLVQPGGFGLHPGPGGEYSVARFTVPATGLYHVSGSFCGDDKGSTTTDVHVLTNGVSLLDGEVTGFGTGTGPSFDFQLTLNRGDQFDFAVGYGSNRDYGFDSTGLFAQIIAMTPPAIVLQPASQAVPVGGNVTFNVDAAGTPPLSYQWRFNSTNLPGATNGNLTLAEVALSQSGTYAVLVSNSFGQALTSNAPLTVLSR